jgi:hypothetical protein
MTGRQLHAILTLVRALSPEELDKFVAGLPDEFNDLIVRLASLSGQLQLGPINSLLARCSAGTDARGACIRFWDHVLTLDKLSQMTLPKERGKPRDHDKQHGSICPN